MEGWIINPWKWQDQFGFRAGERDQWRAAGAHVRRTGRSDGCGVIRRRVQGVEG
jgi:hypothetical protein